MESQTQPAGMPPQLDRRAGDRRNRPTRFFDALLGHRRRSGGRRAEDREKAYVDRYQRTDVLLVLGTFVLNILDAFFTLRWLQLGGREGNPLMQQLLESDDFLFLAQKCFVVAVCLVVLVVHRNFRFAHAGLWALFSIYGLLLLYHVFLQLFATPTPAPL